MQPRFVHGQMLQAIDLPGVGQPEDRSHLSAHDRIVGRLADESPERAAGNLYLPIRGGLENSKGVLAGGSSSESPTTPMPLVPR